jgi:hypothetical protein
LLAGLSTAASDTRESWTEDILGKDVSVVRHDSGSSHYSWLKGALTFGVDVEVPINPHLSIVPEVRFHTYSLYGTVTRPKIAIRWTF